MDNIIDKAMEIKLDVISWIDELRWGDDNKDGFGNIAFSHGNDTKDEEKILVHWLCHIMERQMDYRQIWPIGGYIVSDFIYEYRNKSAKDIFNPDSNDSFIGKDEDKYFLISKIKPEEDDLKKRFDKRISEDGRVIFSSRFFPSDYTCMFRTLRILEDKYHKSIVEYLGTIIKKVWDKNSKNNAKKCIDALAKGLHLLTYKDIGRVNSEDIKEKYDEYCRNDVGNQVESWINSGCEEELSESERFNSTKRVWCSLRDYIKNDEFKKSFKKSLKETFKNDKAIDGFIKDIIDNEGGREYIELPGDVWNNNSKFRNCFEEGRQEEEKKKRFGKRLRDLKQNNDKPDWYPEQFDVTFDFVPRMCSEDKCKFCALNNDLEGVKKNIETLCSNSKGHYCPVILLYCGYYHKCKGKTKCGFMKKIGLSNNK